MLEVREEKVEQPARWEEAQGQREDTVWRQDYSLSLIPLGGQVRRRQSGDDALSHAGLPEATGELSFQTALPTGSGQGTLLALQQLRSDIPRQPRTLRCLFWVSFSKAWAESKGFFPTLKGL